MSKISVASVSQGAMKEGFLTKCGGGIKTWHKRWFVLKGDYLYYFKSPKDDDVTGTIPVLEWSHCQEETNQKRKFCFSISSSKRTYYIVADSAEIMRGWIEAINKVIERKKPGAPQKPPSVAYTPQQTAPQMRSDTTSPAATMNGAMGTTTTPGGSNYLNGPIKPAQESYLSNEIPSGAPPSSSNPRAQLQAAKNAIPFLQDDDSKVLEFWQIWFDSIAPREDLAASNTGMGIDFTVSTSANMQKLTWRTGGPQNIFIQRMVDFFWNVGAPESEIDRLNDVGALINPFKIGSWIDMSAKGGMDGGWFFPVEIPLKLAIEAADPGDAVRRVAEWADKHQVDKVYSIGRDMGAAPPRQTEFRVRLPGSDFDFQLQAGLDAFEMFGFPPFPDEALRTLRSQNKEGLTLSIITSSEGFVRLGLLTPKPSTETVLRLCAIAKADNEELAAFEGNLGTDGPAFAEYQFLKEGFGYGVYQEGFDIVFHYALGEELP